MSCWQKWRELCPSHCKGSDTFDHQLNPIVRRCLLFPSRVPFFVSQIILFVQSCLRSWRGCCNNRSIDDPAGTVTAALGRPVQRFVRQHFAQTPHRESAIHLPNLAQTRFTIRQMRKTRIKTIVLSLARKKRIVAIALFDGSPITACQMIGSNTAATRNETAK